LLWNTRGADPDDSDISPKAQFNPGKYRTELEQARRLVSHHFQMAHTLKRLGVLDKRSLEAVLSKGQATMLLKYVEPLEWGKTL
jgi:hypothetical protein